MYRWVFEKPTPNDTPIHSDSPVIESTPCTTETIIGGSGEWIGYLLTSNGVTI